MSPVTPVTGLVLGTDSLAGLGSHWDTPKRGVVGPPLQSQWSRRSVASNSSRDSVSSESSDAGVGLDSPPQEDLPELEDAFQKAILKSRRVLKHSKRRIRRFSSLPLQVLGSSPILKNISPSWDFNRQRQPKVKGLVFKRPQRLGQRSRVPTGDRVAGRDPFSPGPSSVPVLLFDTPGKENAPESPFVLHQCSSSPSMSEGDDDGFVEILDGEEMKSDTGVPQGMESLLSAPLARQEEAGLPPVKCRKRRQLFRSPSVPSSAIRPILKRTNPHHHEDTPIPSKRQRSLAGTPDEVVAVAEPEAQLLRSWSLSSEEMEELLADDNRELIGDYSKAYLLQTVEGKHPDLKYISPETMVAVLAGQFSSLIASCVVVDCRYPYEYEGGHIKGAINLPLAQDAEELLLKKPLVPLRASKRVILIFHCEFSLERGPRMCRFIREKDRACNEYPHLHYPELYVLKGGYREFFPQYQTYCEPQAYRPMCHEDFQEDLRQFRQKSRTWAGKRGTREPYGGLQSC
ncbi:M-phase inducer phosphatase 2 [Podargus strigoides]